MSTTADLPELGRARAFFLALADATRLRVFLLLAGGEQCVCVIHDALGLPQSTVSRHLAVLRAAGIVKVRRDGRWMHYSLAVPSDPLLARVVRALKGAAWSPGIRPGSACAR
jgi:ArsR family transcriptional regulator